MENSCARPLDVDDAVALVGILTTLEVLTTDGRLGGPELDALRHSLAQGGAVLPGADETEIAAALASLNARLRDSIS
ncbi:hypothetical protein GTU73_03800 [Rathayibacter sp. VKM Ac-2804]|uniref:hypothetical protein n=1 Tax=unclassified Rathayibacter TaxID=2609250 RepID=UPI00132EFAD0|nr:MULTISPECIES: hypothetical protein [unclassified Rathayibacter]NRG40625.1 hypothetical protein [Rathayibacter sp. VKM Ac-2835]QHF23215.1 hypothetical protein GTU73_03800 [Rathayibacter sp. VKM Ac-2804]